MRQIIGYYMGIVLNIHKMELPGNKQETERILNLLQL